MALASKNDDASAGTSRAPLRRRIAKCIRRIALFAGIVLVISLVVAWIVTRITAGVREAPAPVVRLPASSIATEESPVEGAGVAEGELRILTLNLAHGRADGFHQLLTTTKRTRENLERAARLLVERRPHLVALQEADGPSFWSGNFDHVAYLSERARFPWHARAQNVLGCALDYGTAIASRLEIADARAFTFAPSPPTFAKGFLLASMLESPIGPVDVVAIHLDFSRHGVRESQVDDLIARLAGERAKRPDHAFVLAGDLNEDARDSHAPVRRIGDALSLDTWRIDDRSPATFPLLGNRVDWVLVSRDLEIVSYETLEDPVSDHRPVLARIRAR